MKKLIAILLSVLMLCSVVPFATVAAADEPTIQLSIVDELEEINAGEEFQIEVYLNNIPEIGLIGAQVEIGFDTDVFELVTYFDEDEEAWFPQIEVGAKYNATSNKYIMFGPIDEDTGVSKNCLVQYARATATAKQVRTEALFYTATLKVKDDAPSGTYDLSVVNYTKNNFVAYGATAVDFAIENTSITVNGTASECEHEYAYDCSKNCSKCGEETRPEAEHEYFYACDPVCMICYEMTNESAAHSLTHVEAVEATCTVNGNVEYWTCEYCGGCWDNEAATGMPLNQMMVIVPAPGHTYFDDCSAICEVCGYEREAGHNVIHVEAVAPTCETDGNIEYWYCDVCGAAWLDAECTLNTNLLSVVQPASCSYNAIHNEGIEAGCHYTGLIENWYCANCDVYYLDAACAQITNYNSLTIPALKDSADHIEAVEPTCEAEGNIEYWICYECEQVWADEALTQLTNIKNVILPIAHNVLHVEAVEPTCEAEGNIEYWYCDKCGAAWTDELCREVTNLKNVILPVAHNVIHVEAKDATCSELGNIEYWYCDICGQAWLDELCHLNTNLMAVNLPMADHTYSGECDATCNACGAEREVVLPDAPIVCGGNSISENKNGLAFKFDATVNGVIIGEDYKADYSNATVIINGEEHKLVKMGAIVNNKGYENQTLENVDGTYVLNVAAKKAFDLEADGTPSYAIRIVNIPAENLDTVITARSYLTYECGGELITIYGEDIATSYNAELG